MKPKISVIIPNRNSPKIRETILSLKAQTYGAENLEILVAGTDAPGLVKEDARVRMLRSDTPLSPPEARNLGLANATADFILFIDADETAAPDWVEVMMGHLTTDKHAVGGSLNFYPGNYWALVDHLAAHTWYLDDMPAEYPAEKIMPGGNMAVRREVFDRIGPFNEEFCLGEDKEIFHRMIVHGYRPYFEPKARTYHWSWADTCAKVCRHALYYGQATGTLVALDLFRDKVPLGGRGWIAFAVFALPETLLRTAKLFLTRRKLRGNLHAAPGVALFYLVRDYGYVLARKHPRSLRYWFVHR